MNNIVISGYYGFNNIGDESILKAVVENLRDRIENINITVLSQNPESTKEKYQVDAVPRMKVFPIIKAIKNCDLLISGGGSLLQDVTSKKSIIYYLMIMWVAIFFRKKVFIYSQGIGPVTSKLNQFLMVKTLKRLDDIVVRDESSKELLEEIGINPQKIYVTADPVIRIKKPSLSLGENILSLNGLQKDKNHLTIGFAIRGRKADTGFIEEVAGAVEGLIEQYNAQIVLIPFHYSEDMPVAEKIREAVGNGVICLNQKYLTEEMLSIIGNMDLLVGVRLHSLIHAAIMDVPMIGISYDPKVNSFMRSIGLKAMCSVYDFTREYFMEEFEKTWNERERIRLKVRGNTEILIDKLNQNEDLIKVLLSSGR